MPDFVNIEDLRRAAKWNMPKPMCDFVDGGANVIGTPRVADLDRSVLRGWGQRAQDARAVAAPIRVR